MTLFLNYSFSHVVQKH